MSKQLTRREFIKGTAAGALGVAALGLTGIVPAFADEAFASAYDLALSAGSGFAGSQYRPDGADAKGGGDGE